MTTTIGSGLGATWGVVAESVVGTFNTGGTMRWLPFKSDKVKGAKKVVNSEAIHNGGLFMLGGRRRETFREAKGAVELELQNKQLGLFLKAMIGSSPTNSTITSGVYQQVHQPGDLAGLSLSLQSGRPQINGTIQPFSYNGAKITDWEIACSAAGVATLNLTFDAFEEVTSQAYIAPSMVQSVPFAWVDGALTVGGSVSMVSSVATLSGGTTPVGSLSSFSIKGSNPLDVTRQQIGSMNKGEQLANAFRNYSGQVECEFANLTDFYNAFHADTPLTLAVNLTGGQIASSGDNYELNILCPEIYLEGDPPETDGPEVIKVTIPFTIFDDGATTPLQFIYQTSDSTV